MLNLSKVMKISEAFKTREAEGLFSSLLVIVLLLLLPMLGAIAMLIGSVTGLVCYLALSGAHVRESRHALTAVFCVIIALLMAALMGALVGLQPR